MTNTPTPRPDVEEVKALAEADHRGRTPHAKDVLALIAYIEALEKKNSKLKGRVEIMDRAVDRWVPCPDHRDKINHGYEEQRCYVCENETLKRKLAALDGDGDETGENHE